VTALLGILDWGIGGLGFYRLLKARRPHLPVVYWSDAGATPCGKMTPAMLARRVAAVAGAMRARGVTHLVVACNAASTALPALGIAQADGQVETPVGPVVLTGVISHGIHQAVRSRARVLGVVGGRRTITAGLYRRALRQAGCDVIQRVAQPLSGMIERGVLDGPLLRAALARILGPLRQVDALVLACTHYPAIAARISEVLPEAELLDPSEELLRFVLRHWRRATPSTSPRTSPQPSSGRPSADVILTTGDRTSMRRAAWAAFGVRLSYIRQVRL
jgi:glutamate racemase